jgi:signal transduction histidine kinase
MSLRRIQWLAVVLPALCVGLFEFIRHQWLESVLPTALGNLTDALIVAWIVYIFVQIFIKLIRRSVMEATQAREESAAIAERQRIAREMHDSIAQSLFYVGAELHEVENLVASGQSEEARSKVRTVRKQIRATHHKIRAVIADLRQQDELDFGEEVRRTTTELAERLGMKVTSKITGSVALPVSSRQHVLAIIQEALVNTHRHSRTQEAEVRLATIGEDTMIEVSDEGVGFDLATVPREERYGLTIMEERAQMADGQLRVDSLPGGGTRIAVYLSGAAS